MWQMEETTVTYLAGEAVETLREASVSPYLLVAEHAGNRVPAPWRGLGLAPAFLDTHFAFDIGVDALTRRLSEELDAAAVIGHYSRLFIDYNRPPNEWDFARPDLGGIPVPGNVDLHSSDRAMRMRVAWQPLESAINELSVGRSALVSVHSFTPVMSGQRREVDIGILWREPGPFTEAVLEEMFVEGEKAGFRIGDNEPYDWRGVTAYTLVRHGLEMGRPCLYLEVCNEVLSDPEKSEKAALVVARVLSKVAERLWLPAAKSLDVAERRR